MKKTTYISPAISSESMSVEQCLLENASVTGTNVKSGNASEELEVLSRESATGYSVWGDDEE